MPNTTKLMFDGESLDCLSRTDASGETTFYTKADENGDYRHIKFAPGIDLAEAVKAHNAANKVAPVFAHEVETETDDELSAWLGQVVEPTAVEAEEEKPA